MGLVLYFSSQKFQSTLPQRERRWEFKECNIATYISIHAPTKGVTVQYLRSLIQMNFNPRSHKGSDVDE